MKVFLEEEKHRSKELRAGPPASSHTHRRTPGREECAAKSCALAVIFTTTDGLIAQMIEE